MKKKYFICVALAIPFVLASCGKKDTCEHSYQRFYETTATYRKEGNISYKHCTKCDKYFDAKGNEINQSDAIIPVLSLTGKVTKDENGLLVTDIDTSLFEANYGLGDILSVSDGTSSYDMPYTYFTEALQEGDNGILPGLSVSIGKEGGASSLFKVDDSITVTFKEAKNYTYTVKLFNYMEEQGEDNLSDPILLDGNEITIEYKSSDYDTYHEYYSTVLDAITKEEKSYEEIEALYGTFWDNYYFILDEYLKVSLMADKTAEDTYYDLSDELYSLLSDIETQDQKIDIAASTSKYRNQYFEDMTDEEIDAYIATLDVEASQAKNDTSAAMQAALNAYYSGDTDGITALKEYCLQANKLASLEGYSDYLSYAYPEVYGREYEVSDTANLKDYLKNYVLKTENLIISEYQEVRNSASDDEWNEFIDMYYDFFGANMDYINDYSIVVGGDFRNDFISYFTSGNYYYSNIENDNVTGYQNTFSDGTPYMFLGPDCQDMHTLIHEFGHYNAALTGGESDSMDLCETQSQGDEALYYLYLDNYHSSAASRAYMLYMAYNMLAIVEEGILMNELEKYVYTADSSSLTLESINSKWNEICTEIGLDDYISDGADSSTMEWIMAVLLNYQGYYISYATSAIAALEIWAEGMKDYTNALEIYRNVYKDNGDDTFTEVLEESGLKDVFTEEAYKNIFEAFKAYLA